MLLSHNWGLKYLNGKIVLMNYKDDEITIEEIVIEEKKTDETTRPCILYAIPIQYYKL